MMQRRPNLAQSVAVATPCMPAPVSGDYPLLAHAACEQHLAEHIVDLVCARMIEVLALEVNLRSAELLGQPLGEIERRGPAHVMREIARHLRSKSGILARLRIRLFQVEDKRHERLGHKAPAIDAEMPVLVGAGTQ